MLNAISPEVFNRDFQIVEKEIGSGNCGSVSKIRKIKDGRMYALKKINTFSDKQHTAALSEVVNSCLLKDPGVVKVQYYFTKTNYVQNSKIVKNYQFNVIMELCEMSLGQLIKRIKDKKREYFSKEQIWMFLKTMSRVFAKMQKENMLHRDIKPDNILVNMENGQVKQFKVADFGYSVMKGDYHTDSITGTKEYTSPKIYEKFLDENKPIPGGINEKDDMYSLGKTFLEMIKLHNTNNWQINDKLFSYLQGSAVKEYVHLLQKMLASEEKNRFDFIQLEKEIQDIQYRKKNIIDVDNLPAQNNYFNISQNLQHHKYSQQINPSKSVTIEIQTDEFCEPTKKKTCQKKIQENDAETRYFNNQEGTSDNEKQKIYLRTKDLHFRGNEIYCVKIFNQFALLGSDSRLVVIPLNNVIKRGISYTVRLKGIQDVKPIFRIKDIFINHEHIVLFLDSNQFIHIDTQLLYMQINNAMQNHEELLKKQKIKQVFQSYEKNHDYAKIYDIEFQELTATLQSQELTCVEIVDHSFCGVPKAGLMGFLKGQIKIHESQEYKTIHSAGQRIDKMKAIDENRLIYTSCQDIKILEFTRIDSEIKLKKIYQNSFGSEIIYLRIFKQEKLISQENTVPIFVEVVTRNGNYFRLDEKLQMTHLTSGKQTIRYVTQTNFNWSIKKANKQENDPNYIVEKKYQLNYENNSSLCYLTSSGLLKYVHSGNQICSVLFSRAKLFHVDSQITIICHSSGRVEILYTSKEPMPKIIPKSNELSKNFSKMSFPTREQFMKNTKHYVRVYLKEKSLISTNNTSENIKREQSLERMNHIDYQSQSNSQVEKSHYHTEQFNMLKKSNCLIESGMSLSRKKVHVAPSEMITRKN